LFLLTVAFLRVLFPWIITKKNHALINTHSMKKN